LKKELDDALERSWTSQPPKEAKQKHKKENNSKDASIADAAMFKGFTLITCDRALAAAAEKHGINVLNPRARTLV
jgi:rRNA-processing protein FCF1